MRMQKEEKIVVVLLLMALGSLAVAFWAFAPDESDGGPEGLEQLSVSDSAPQKDAGQSVEGRVLEMKPTKSGGNLLIRLDSTALAVFVSASAGAREIQERVKAGDRVRIKGAVVTYQGNEELAIFRQTDIQVLSA
jgi:hypothetical protein